jgi:hypothetical protein
MLPDNLNIDAESDSIDITIDTEVPEVKLTVDSPSDVIVMTPPEEVKLTIETKEVELVVDSPLPDVKLVLESYPDVIVLPTTGLTGPPGPEGPQGPTGPEGPPGLQTTYVFTQLAVATTWNITHNLDRYPAITVIDTGGSEILPDIFYVSANVVTLFFDNATSGKAYLN